MGSLRFIFMIQFTLMVRYFMVTDAFKMTIDGISNVGKLFVSRLQYKTESFPTQNERCWRIRLSWINSDLDLFRGHVN
ncbi:hypothetical protein SD70_29680 [Gordoniibacillus kamchatkensis]|uniref:Secreted protein n=1 Tax=Gordoniibacillus kamchatkensis TaxID=1590651 RepID=A0ABR5AAN5_9BACL|nr:hypothetical protein SD70_29680 [Paenibacillus sp. VKM B-2647]